MTIRRTSISGPRALARRLGVGRWLWRNVYAPTANIRWLTGWGLRGGCAYLAGNVAMRRATARLPAQPAKPGALDCVFMTGRRHWHLTAFCAYSLSRVLPQGIRPTMYDDGSLEPRAIATLKRIFPRARIVSIRESEEQLEARLPANRFPLLRIASRNTMMRKLTALRAGSTTWQLYLDSDMLFFDRPNFLEQHAAVHRPCYMYDHGDGFYVRTPEELSRITGDPVPARVNAGIVGLDDAQIDWERVESWCGHFRSEELSSLLFEQTLTAMILGGLEPRPAPAEDYAIVYQAGARFPRATLLHYLYRSKLDYVTREWRRVLPAACA